MPEFPCNEPHARKIWDVFKKKPTSYSLTAFSSAEEAHKSAELGEHPTVIIDSQTRIVEEVLHCTIDQISDALNRYYTGWKLKDVKDKSEGNS